jgi:hypothetical protein
MRGGYVSGCTAQADEVTGVHLLAFTDADLGEVGVEGE